VSCLAEPRDILVCGPILDLRFPKPEGMLKYLRRAEKLHRTLRICHRAVIAIENFGAFKPPEPDGRLQYA
jgi:hypothetical protein